MKLHPRNRPVKGDPFVPNRFIFGDAIDGETVEPYEYVVHTGSPAFVCRLVGNDDTPFIGRDGVEPNSAVLYDDDENITHYVCNAGFRLFDFNFWDEKIPTAAALQKICDEAINTYERLRVAYARNELGTTVERELMVAPVEQLSLVQRTNQVKNIIGLSITSLTDSSKQQQFFELVRSVLLAGDESVFTEAQLALLDHTEARQALVNCARKAIALPEAVRKDGSIVDYELWALPLVFAREQGGVWWHFPKLERMEGVLANVLQLPADAVLWVSPTLFTFEMLRERACQPLIHLAQVMESGRDLALDEPEAARETYDVENQTKTQQLILCWIPFLLERGALTVEKARRLASKTLSAAMPVIQDALTEQMPYAEAELFAPLPWWQSLVTAVGAFNRRRLGLTLALLATHGHEPSALRVVIEYLPERLAYIVIFRDKASSHLAQAPWLVVPDIAPDRVRAQEDLIDCLRESGVTTFELSRLSLH